MFCRTPNRGSCCISDFCLLLRLISSYCVAWSRVTCVVSELEILNEYISEYIPKDNVAFLLSRSIYLDLSRRSITYLKGFTFFQFLFCSFIHLGDKIVGFCNHLNISFILFNPSIPPRLSHIFFLIPLPPFFSSPFNLSAPSILILHSFYLYSTTPFP